MSRYTYVRQKQPNQWVAVAVSDLKVQIKAYILDKYLDRVPKPRIFEAIRREIGYLIKELEEDGKGDSAESYREELEEFAEEAYEQTRRMVGSKTAYALALTLANPVTLTEKQKQEIAQNASVTMYVPPDQVARLAPRHDLGRTAYSSATAADKYYREVHKETKQLLANFTELTEGKQYLIRVNPRSISEINVRFKAYQEQKQKLISDGVKLVYVPPHSNCSKRCQPYQGKVYSLTGQREQYDRGTAIPIEDVAENVTVQGKRDPSRTYYAGLFSYNCRHRMRPYHDGQFLEVIPKDVIETTRKIEQRQREMEREIRTLKEQRLYYRVIKKKLTKAQQGVMQTEINGLTDKIKDKTKSYESYSASNHVPYNPTRLVCVSRYDEETGRWTGESIYDRTHGTESTDVIKTKIERRSRKNAKPREATPKKA